MTERPSKAKARSFRVVLVALCSVAVVGFFAELHRDPPPLTGYSTEATATGQAARVKTYSELRESSPGPTRELYLASAELLHAQLPNATGLVSKSPGDREAMLATRRSRRAYDGAPPVIPHPIDQRARPNCLACHERGVQFDDLVAPVLSHRPFASCVQCHAPASPRLLDKTVASPPPGDGALTFARTSENAFAPREFGGLGSRAWPGAPPTVPHSLHMREQCSSCHGVTGKVGLRTPHADRRNCQQCHVLENGKGGLLSQAPLGGAEQ